MAEAQWWRSKGGGGKVRRLGCVCSGKFNESVKYQPPPPPPPTGSKYWIRLDSNGDGGRWKSPPLRFYLNISVIQMANLQPSDACREVGAQRVLVCHLPASGKTFIYLFLLSLVPSLADSVKCLHEVDALCQFVHRPAHFKGIHL